MRKPVLGSVAKARQERKPDVAEYRSLGRDGTIHAGLWREENCEYVEERCTYTMLGMAVDITDLSV